MAKYRFTHVATTVSAYTDATYGVYYELVNTPGGGSLSTVTFGNSVSKAAAIAALQSDIEGRWVANGVSSYFTFVSLAITEGNQSITVTLVYDIDDSMFVSTSIVPNRHGSMVANVYIYDSSDVIQSDETITNTISATALCLPIPCDTCKDLVYKSCQASYTVVTGLTPATTYTVLLTDQNEVRYTQQVTSDVSGDLTFDTADIPTSVFTQESGGVRFEVYSDATLATKETLSVDLYTYGCMYLTFAPTITTTNNL